jgi:hypothetical protein
MWRELEALRFSHTDFHEGHLLSDMLKQLPPQRFVSSAQLRYMNYIEHLAAESHESQMAS